MPKYKQSLASKILGYIDIYSVAINFTVDPDKERVTNAFGGFMSLIFLLSCMGYVGAELTTMYRMENTSFFISNQRKNSTRDKPIELGKFDDTFNLIIGSSDKSSDFFNNTHI